MTAKLAVAAADALREALDRALLSVPAKSRDAVDTFLRKLDRGLAKLERQRADYEKKLADLDKKLGWNVKHVRKLEDAERAFSNARRWLDFLTRWSAEPFEAPDPSIAKGLEQVSQQVQRRIAYLRAPEPAAPVKKRGAPRIEDRPELEDVYMLAAVTVNRLVKRHGMERPTAERVVAAFLTDRLVALRTGKRTYKNFHRSLHRYMHDRGY